MYWRVGFASCFIYFEGSIEKGIDELVEIPQLSNIPLKS
jgi:hypothetical protein